MIVLTYSARKWGMSVDYCSVDELVNYLLITTGKFKDNRSWQTGNYSIKSWKKRGAKLYVLTFSLFYIFFPRSSYHPLFSATSEQFPSWLIEDKFDTSLAEQTRQIWIHFRGIRIPKLRTRPVSHFWRRDFIPPFFPALIIFPALRWGTRAWIFKIFYIHRSEFS